MKYSFLLVALVTMLGLTACNKPAALLSHILDLTKLPTMQQSKNVKHNPLIHAISVSEK